MRRAGNSWGWTPVSSWSGSDHYPWDKTSFSPPAQRWRTSLEMCWAHRYLEPLLLTPVSSQPGHTHTHTRSCLEADTHTLDTAAHSVVKIHTVSLFPELLLCWSESCLVSASVATASVSYLHWTEQRTNQTQIPQCFNIHFTTTLKKKKADSRFLSTKTLILQFSRSFSKSSLTLTLYSSVIIYWNDIQFIVLLINYLFSHIQTCPMICCKSCKTRDIKQFI